ncbi:MAG: hypothetical protein A2381_10640 [Bdellovibrionales bacterium RIFOXYB1_FULL_37_110]|nr:MAG: hypothetical protein A2181_06780 [Bdellovibrionales bacterium RIFOXYA1_FULL_38_20]OFZ51122.1 MAG: hypothetical protein A2417_17620 [Bdellovibrionales bacterium RIFOXYC1_FULL_37_79]OFZ61229.1 MAG: hypothetical protein A2381_10640 [Bdellovibrionales bacterium RIFOXYB1_FULL_37_110]OFZ61656.1 MAG: hypothetical protein A2577_10735 [Bdellovibrionales bacterium RIFOXYD1_FULL_36_51]
MIEKNKIYCFKCRSEINIEAGTKIMRRDECDKCGASLRCCRMCIHYDISSYNECRESVAERILEKEKANFCDYFVFENNLANKEDEKNRHLDAAKSLFKN